MNENNGASVIITKVFDSFRKISPALVALAIVSSFILFAPVGVLGKLGLSSLPSNVIMIIGLIFLLSVMLIITILLSSFAKRIQKWKIINEKIADCRMLNEKQKEIVRKMLHSKDKSSYLCATDGDVVFLESKSIICHPTQAVDQNMMFRNIYKYCPQPWVIELWLKNLIIA